MTDFGPQIVTQEWWSGFGFWVLVAGLAGELAVLAVPSNRGRLEKTLSVLFTLVIIVGCAFEHVADNRIADLVARQEAEAGLAIAQAKDSAATAIADAAFLGVSQKDLHDFVVRKQREIGTQFDQFKSFTADEKKRAEATIADLNRNRAALDKARNDAVVAAAKAEKSLASMAEVRQNVAQLQATVAWRHLTDDQSRTLVEAFSRYKGREVTLEAGIDDPEATRFANELVAPFSKAGLTAFMFSTIWTSGTPVGVHVHVRKSEENIGNDIALSLRKIGIEPDAIYVPDQPEEVSRITVVVGSKPPPP